MEGERKEGKTGAKSRRNGRRWRRGRVVVIRRAWWTIHGCQEGSMASHTHLDSPSTKSKQPYKVAGLRFNPKFISSISKSLSRGLEREREADEDDDAFPSLRRPFRFLPVFPPLSPPLSFSPFPTSPSSPAPTLFSLSHLARPSECSLVHRCILSIPLHYDSYIAIFIISAIHRCWRDRGLTSFPLLSHLVLLFLDFVRFALSLSSSPSSALST